MRKLLSLLVICLLSMGLTPQQKVILSGVPNWVPNPQNPPDIAINWQQNIAWRKKGGLTSIAALGVTITRASAETNLLSTSPSGFAFTSVPSGVIASGPAFGGRQTWEARTNFLLNSTAPVTQTTGSLANGTYTLWVNGSGTATMSSGTATGCGTSAASQGTPISFTTSGTAGTCTVTVGGSLNFFQLELNPGSVSAPSPGIVTAGATVTRAADVITMPITVGSVYTIFEQAIPQLPILYGTNQAWLGVDDTTTNNRDYVGRVNTTGGSRLTVVSGGAATVQVSSVVLIQNAVNTIAASFVAGSQVFFTNNGGIATNAAAALAISPTEFSFGREPSGGTTFDGVALVDAIWQTQAVPNAQLQSMK